LPRANLLFRATDNVNLYATWSKGRRSPVVNLGSARINGQIVANNTLIDEEKTTNYEIGIKGSFGAVNFAIGAYLLQYKNFQISVLEDGNPVAQTRSAGSATNKGIEAEFTAAVSSNLSVFANGAYIDAKVDDDPRFVAFSGDQFRLQSKYQFSAGGTATLPISEGIELYATPTVTYRSRVFFTLPNDPVTSQAPVTLVNLRAGFQHPDGKWQITGFAQNLLNNEYVLDAGNTGGGFGIPTFIRGLPRLYGIEALYRFY
jgi:outer membrane receptor protein involved in Fe transport